MLKPLLYVITRSGYWVVFKAVDSVQNFLLRGTFQNKRDVFEIWSHGKEFQEEHWSYCY